MEILSVVAAQLLNTVSWKLMRFRTILIEVLFSVLLQVIEGNSNTYLPSKRELDPPVWASKIRFLPYSYHRRTVCMRVEIYGCYWNGEFIVDTLRFNKQNKSVSGHLAETFQPSCRLKVSTGNLVSHRVRRKVIFHDMKERAGIAQYQRGNWRFIVSITSWHHTVSARKLVFHKVCEGAGITHCRPSGQGFKPHRALTIVYDLLKSSSLCVLCLSLLLCNAALRKAGLIFSSR